MEGEWSPTGLPVWGVGLQLSQGELDRPDLVQAVQAGEAAAITRVLDLCLPTLRRVVSRQFGLSPEEAEDVLQEIRITFWRAARRFRGESSLQTYLVQIACWKCGQYLRARDRHPWESLEGGRVPGRTDVSRSAVERVAMEKALEQLPARQREVLDLYYGNSKSYQEIAAEMGIAVGTVGAMKAEALRKLRRVLSEDASSAAGLGE